MKNFFEKLYYQNDMKSWAISLGIVIASVLLAKLFFWFVKNVVSRIISHSKLRLDDIILASIERPTVGVIVSTGTYFALVRLSFSEQVDGIIHNIYMASISFSITWFLVGFTKRFFDEYLLEIVQKSENELDDQLFPILKKSIVVGLWILGSIVALNNAGFDVGALIAGMGIGGLALAMAAKDTVSNFFGGITIFADKVFKVGQRIKVNGYDGFVEEIGIRSTRLRTLEKTMVTIPNAKFIDGLVENISLEPARKITSVLGLLYSTTPEDVKKAQDILYSICEKNSSVASDPAPIASFTEFADCSLNITFIYYISPGKDYFGTINEMNMAVLEEFNKNSLGFAFPTRTIEIDKKDL